MKSLSLKEENIIKDIRNLFWLKKELNNTAIKDIRYLFRQKNNNKKTKKKKKKKQKKKKKKKKKKLKQLKI